MALTNKLSAIGDAIREKTGTTGLLKLDDMPSAIKGIQSGGKYSPRYLYSSISFREYTGTELEHEITMLDTTCLTKMNQMFYNCRNLTNLDLSGWSTSNVTTMGTMFYSCSNLNKLDLSNFDTSNVTSMSSMFQGCANLTNLDLSSFDTSNVIDMGTMFFNCSKLKYLDIRNFVFDKVTNYSLTFYAVPNDCLIIVKSDIERDWILANGGVAFTNIKTVAEYQAEGGV